MGTAMKVVLAGAGKIGEAIVALLSESGDYELTLLEQDAARLAPWKLFHRTHTCTLSDPGELARILAGHDAVISACPYFLTPAIAAAAREAGVHYFDLTEDVESTREVKRLAEGAEIFRRILGRGEFFNKVVFLATEGGAERAQRGAEARLSP